jgi:hypothetical protein
MAVRLPGGVTSLNAFWRHLEAGDDLLTTLPDDSQAGVKMVRRKGVVSAAGAAAAFDAQAPLSAANAAGSEAAAHETAAPLPPPAWALRLPVSRSCLMGPEARVLLEVCCSALEDAGLDPWGMGEATLDGGPLVCGTFLCGGSLPHLPHDLPARAAGDAPGGIPRDAPGGARLVDLNAFRRDDPAGYFAAEIGFDKDYLAAAVAHALDLQVAPCLSTACCLFARLQPRSPIRFVYHVPGPRRSVPGGLLFGAVGHRARRARPEARPMRLGPVRRRLLLARRSGKSPGGPLPNLKAYDISQ